MANITDIEILVKARYPLVYVVTHEETRLQEELLILVNQRRAKLGVWSVATGMQYPGAKGYDSSSSKGNHKPNDAFDNIALATTTGDEFVYILKDFHRFFDDIVVVRAAREMVARLAGRKVTIIFVAPTLKLPVDLENDIHVIDYDLYTREQAEILAVAFAGKHQVQMNSSVVDAAIGLTKNEMENAFAKSLVMTKKLDANVISKEKRQMVKKTGLLEFVDTNVSLSDVGGHSVLKKWIRSRAKALSPAAKKYGMENPKGMLLVGPPGTGKTFIAQTVANAFGVPLIRLDIGRLFGSLVGQTEQNVRQVIKTIEAVSPCVVHVDEIEKAFSGSSGAGDSGTSSRMLGAFLEWLQNKEKFCFVVATANQARALPAELIRKGRFDEIWFCDLPTLEERAELFEMYISKHENNGDFNFSTLAGRAEGFTGAEIKAIVMAAKWDAFEHHTEESPVFLAHMHVAEQIHQTMPLSKQMAESINNMRVWALANAKSTSTKSVSQEKVVSTFRDIETN